MPCVDKYALDYVDACRTRFTILVSAFEALSSTVGATDSRQRVAMAAFEPHVFNNMLVALEAHFVHRAQLTAAKEGNPLDEVRMLVTSIMNNDSVLTGDASIPYDPAKSVLKLKIGDTIRLDVSAFSELAAAFLAEITARYVH